MVHDAMEPVRIERTGTAGTERHMGNAGWDNDVERDGRFRTNALAHRMTHWFGIFDGPRLVCVEDDIEIARKIAKRLSA